MLRRPNMGKARRKGTKEGKELGMKTSRYLFQREVSCRLRTVHRCFLDPRTPKQIEVIQYVNPSAVLWVKNCLEVIGKAAMCQLVKPALFTSKSNYWPLILY